MRVRAVPDDEVDVTRLPDIAVVQHTTAKKEALFVLPNISLFDETRSFAYHSLMTSEETNTSRLEQDPLTIGELIPLQQAAEYAGITKEALRNYVRRGRLRARKLGSQWVTTRAAINDYLASRHEENIPKKYRKGN